MTNYHVSVLLQEVLSYLQVKKGEKYIDATLGGGGHTKEILEKGGNVLGIDQDLDAIKYVQNEFKIQNSKLKIGTNVTLVRGNFKEIGKIATENGFDQVHGIIFDLGISSHHVDAGERGFSFLKDAPLDMRMDQNSSVRAADLVNGLSERELSELFTKYAEEPFARRIAKAIALARKEEPIVSTVQLAMLIKRTIPGRPGVHPATRVFQALRIAVNDELYVLFEGLTQAVELLKSEGRICVISFHSLEDRIVKRLFLQWEKENKGRNVFKKPLVPSDSEQEENRRSRSSKLRVFEKI